MKLKFIILFFIFSSIVYGQKFYTSDIDNFYQAFDLACNDTTNAQRIFDCDLYDLINEFQEKFDC